MLLAFASDHAGYNLKETLKKVAIELGHEIKDYGTDSNESVDYPDFIKLAAIAVSKKEADKAIVVCGSGIGASMVANKVSGIRCALCTNIMTAKYSRLHNDANVFAIGERIVNECDAVAMLKTWLTTEFEGGRHKRRVDKIHELEK